MRGAYGRLMGQEYRHAVCLCYSQTVAPYCGIIQLRPFRT